MLQRKLNPKSKKQSPLREWLHAFMFALIAASLIHWLIATPSQVPTSSMENTILAGDFMLVSKLHYGARTPKTLLQIPLMHQTIRGTNLPAYLPWIQMPMYRLPSFSTVKRGDKVVFNCTTEVDKPIDIRSYYIKRCIGLPGDSIHIEKGCVSINGEKQPIYSGIQYRYYVQTALELTDDFFDAHNIREYMPANAGYVIHTTPQVADSLKNLTYVEAVKMILCPPDLWNPAIYPHSQDLSWNEDNFGPITIPSKGMEIEINDDTIIKYQQLIILQDTKEKAYVADGKLWINDQEVTHYTFQQDYYFMMGDNRHNSMDSRYTGFIPADHIIGKALLIICSINANKTGFRKIRWNRCFRSLND